MLKEDPLRKRRSRPSKKKVLKNRGMVQFGRTPPTEPTHGLTRLGLFPRGFTGELLVVEDMD